MLIIWTKISDFDQVIKEILKKFEGKKICKNIKRGSLCISLHDNDKEETGPSKNFKRLRVRFMYFIFEHVTIGFTKIYLEFKHIRLGYSCKTQSTVLWLILKKFAQTKIKFLHYMIHFRHWIRIAATKCETETKQLAMFHNWTLLGFVLFLSFGSYFNFQDNLDWFHGAAQKNLNPQNQIYLWKKLGFHHKLTTFLQPYSILWLQYTTTKYILSKKIALWCQRIFSQLIR